jgi:hypothetical protein
VDLEISDSRPYIAAELPSNLLLKVGLGIRIIMRGSPLTLQAVGPDLMLPSMVALWGLVTTLQGG